MTNTSELFDKAWTTEAEAMTCQCELKSEDAQGPSAWLELALKQLEQMHNDCTSKREDEWRMNQAYHRGAMGASVKRSIKAANFELVRGMERLADDMRDYSEDDLDWVAGAPSFEWLRDTLEILVPHD